MKTSFIFAFVIALSAPAGVVFAQPSVTTGGADEITSNSANFNGNANPYGCGTFWVFEWGTDTNYGNWGPNGIYGVHFSCGWTTVHVNSIFSGLIPNTKYHYRLDIYNYVQYYYGADTNFTTLPLPPTVSTSVASFTNAFSAGLAGIVNPNGAASTAYYQWGLTTAYGSNTPSINVGSGNNNVNVPYTLTGLSPNTTYHYQLWATNSGGSNPGGDQSFVTSPPPPPVFQSVSSVGGVILFTWQSLPGTNYRCNTRTILLLGAIWAIPCRRSARISHLKISQGPTRIAFIVWKSFNNESSRLHSDKIVHFQRHFARKSKRNTFQFRDDRD